MQIPGYHFLGETLYFFQAGLRRFPWASAVTRRWLAEIVGGFPVVRCRLRFCVAASLRLLWGFLLGWGPMLLWSLLVRRFCWVWFWVLCWGLMPCRCLSGIRCLSFWCRGRCLWCDPSCTICSLFAHPRLPSGFWRISLCSKLYQSATFPVVSIRVSCRRQLCQGSWTSAPSMSLWCMRMRLALVSATYVCHTPSESI